MAQGGVIKYGIEFNVNQQNLNTLKKELQNLKTLNGQNLIDLGVSKNLDEAEIKLRELKNSISQLEVAFNKSFSSSLGITNLTKFNNELKKMDLNKIATSFNSIGIAGQNAFKTLTTNILTTNLQLKESNTLLNKMAETMSNTIKWGIASSVMNTFTGSVSKAFNYVKALDSSLNDIRIVTNKSAEEMEKFAIYANRASTNLGASTRDFTEAALIYYQQGLSDSEANARAEVTLKAANVTKQSTQEVSEQLTAVWNGYKVNAQEAELYVDKLAAVAATTAADLEELSTGMSKVASAANLMGVDIDQLNAQLATIVSVTRQAPESVGTALKTIYARISDIKSGLDDETTFGNYTAKMAEYGVNVLDATGNLRDMGDVIEEIGGKWNNLSREQQVGLSQTIAGTRQYNNLLALFDNWNMYTQAIDTSKNALGTLQQQQDIYMESTSAHLQQLSTTTERIYKDIIDSKGLNDLIDLLTKAVSGIANYIEAIGGSGPILMQIGAALSSILGPKIAQGFATTISNFKKIGENAKQVNAEIQLLQQFKGLQINDASYKKLLDMKQSLVDLNETLTDEQREYANSLIQTTNELANQRDAFIANRDLAQAFYNTVIGDNNKIDLSQAFSLEDAEQYIKQLDEIVASYETKIGAANKEIQKEVLENKDANVMDSFIESAHEILNNNVIKNEKAIKDLAKAVQEYEQIIPDGNDIISDEQYEKVEAFKNAYSKAADLIIQKSNEAKKIILQHANGIENGFKNSLNVVEGDFQAFIDKIDIQYIAEKFSQINSSVLMLGSSIESIKRLPNIWNDENLSGGEKLLQTIMAIGNASQGLISTYKLIHTTAETITAVQARNAATELLYKKSISNTTEEISKKTSAIKEEKDVSGDASIKEIEDEVLYSNMVVVSTAAINNKKKALGEKNIQENDMFGVVKEISEQSAARMNIQEFLEKNGYKGRYSQIPTMSLSNLNKFTGDEKESKKLSKIFGTITAQGHGIARGEQEDFNVKNKSGTKRLINFLNSQLPDAQENLPDVKNDLDDIAKKGETAGKALNNMGGGKGNSIFTTLKSDLSTIGNTLKAIPPQAYIAAAAVAVIAGSIYLIVKAVNKQETDLKKAIEETEEAAKKAKNEFSELADKVSNYKSAKNGLDGLTEGTLEWYQAIVKANEAAQELIDTWGLIAGEDYTFGANGLINLDEDKLNERIFKEQQKVYQAQAGNYAAQANYIAQSQKGGLPNLYKNFANDINKELIKQGSQTRVTEINAKAILSGEDHSILTKIQDISEKTYNLDEFNIKNNNDKYDNINKSILDVDNSIEKTSIDIQGAIEKYRAQYRSMSAQEQALRLQAADQSIRGFGTREDVQTYNNMTSTGQNLMQQYIANHKDDNIGNWQDVDSTGNAIKGALGGMAAGAAAGAIAGSVVPIIGNVIGAVGGAIAGGIGGLLGGGIGAYAGSEMAQAHNEKEMKKLYAQYMLGYNYDNGIWTDEDGKVQKEEDVLNGIDYTTAKNAYNSGDIATRKSTQEVVSQLSTANTTAKNKGFNAESSNYISQAVVAANNGLDFDYGLLTKEELAEVRDQVGFTWKQIIQTSTESGEEAKSIIIDLNDSVSNTVRRQAADVGNFNKELESQATALGTTSKALKLYAKTVRDADNNLLELNQTSAKLVANEYKFNKTWNESADTFENNAEAYDKWVDAARNGGKVSYDVADAVAEVQESLEKFLGYEVSSDFMEQNYETIQQLLTGTEEEAEQAYKKLQELALEEEWNKIGQSAVENAGLTMDAWLALKNTIQSLNEMELLNDDSLSSLRQYIESAHMSYEELQKFLDDNHLVVSTETGETPDLKAIEIPGQTETRQHTISGTNPYTGQKLEQDLTWKETVETISTPYYTLADNVQVKKDSTNFNVNTSTNFTRSSGTNKSGSNNEPDKMDPIEAEIDRYHKVNTQITKVDNALSKLQSQQDKFVGSKLINNLNNQWALLNTQIENYNEKLRIANEEQAELASELTGKGVVFNADGTISNYAEVIKAQEDYVNSLINNYNSMSKEQQESYKETVEQAQKDFDKFQENLDRYDELVSDFIPGLQQEIQDAMDEQIEINIQKFNMEIEITLDMTQATRDWNEWKKRAIDGINPEDIYGNANARLQDFYTYFNEAATAEAQVGTRHLNDTLEELYKMDRGENNIYGDNRAQALEDLRTYYTQLMQSITDVIELQDELHQSLLDEMDEVQEKFDEQIASYEFLRDLINHDIKVIQLTLGEDAYGEMAKFYEAQQNNYEKQLDFQRQQKDFWYAQMQAAEEGTEEWESARDKWKDAVSEFNSILEEGLQNAVDKFQNAINNIFKNLNNTITGGMGLDYVNTQWDLINQNADRYLDTINATYGIRELEKKYIDSINDTDNISAQQRLKKLMDEQLEDLKQRDRLTQYDLDRANKLYEIELARIALEEAQRNKSQMRLRRDSQGNYTYQYVADDDAIKDAESQLSNLYNDLYNFDRDRYNQVLNDIYSIWDSYQQAMAEAALINDPELRAEKERLIQEQYNELMMQVEEDYQIAKYDLQESFFWDWVDLNNMTLDQFKALTDNEKDIIMTDMVPTWKNGISEMIDAMIAEGGFASVTQQAWLDIKEAENQYAEDMTELETISGQTFETIINGEDDSIGKAKDLIKANDELIDAYDKELAAVQSVYDKVRALRQEYEAAEKAAIAAAKAAYEYEQKELLKQQEDAKNQNQTTSSAGISGNNSTNNSNENNINANGANSGSNGGNGSPEVGETVTYVGGKYYASSYGDGPTGSRGPGKKVKITAIANGRPYPIHVMSNDSAYGWLRQDQLSGYDTGGYTGDWNNGGRLALLHQKELVLNAEDTKNMLNTVAIMRSLAYSLGSNMLARLAGASAAGYNGTNGGAEALEQNVHIDAQFPNVRNAAEIEEALNNLVNAASQRIYER